MQPAHYRPLSISQNFLHRHALVDRLLDASSIRAGDLVFDLGAGRGLITDRLAQRGCRVVAVEKDLELDTRLHARFDSAPRSTFGMLTCSPCPSRAGPTRSLPIFRSTPPPPSSIV
jgi:protein-L-isoaspartate O-methyltransferase